MRVLTLISIFSALFFASHLAAAQTALYATGGLQQYVYHPKDEQRPVTLPHYEAAREAGRTDGLATARANNTQEDTENRVNDRSFVSQSRPSFRPYIGLGWTVSSGIAIELVAHDLGETELVENIVFQFPRIDDEEDIINDVQGRPIIDHEINNHYSTTIETQALELSSVWMTNLGPNADAFLRLGWFEPDVEFKTNHPLSSDLKRAHSKAGEGREMWGVGLSLDLASKTALTIHATNYGNDVRSFGLGLRYQF